MSAGDALSGQQFVPIRKGDLSTTDARRSPEVSHEEFQQRAARGKSIYEGMSKKAAPVEGTSFDRNFERITDRAHKAVQEPWGGATINSHTGRAVRQGADSYALTARPPGMASVSVPADADHNTFRQAMHTARNTYGEVLARQGHHLGVFHDADKGTIDIDPVVVVKKQRDAEDIGAYTHAVGGAYHFKSGDGYWPPHVKD